MDVNSSPGVVAFARPDGNGVERPNGVMFDSFLSIASGLGSIEQPEQDDSQHQRYQDEGASDAKTSDEKMQAKQSEDSDREQADQRRRIRRLSGENELRKLIERQGTQIESDGDNLRVETPLDETQARNADDASAEVKVAKDKDVDQAEQDDEPLDTALAADVDVKSQLKVVDLSTQFDGSDAEKRGVDKDFDKDNNLQASDTLKTPLGETSDEDAMPEFLENKRTLRRLLDQELNARREAGAQNKSEPLGDKTITSDFILMGDDDGPDKSRFLDQDLVRRTQAQMDKMNGQTDVKSGDGSQLKEGGGKEEWNRLLQFSAANVRQGEQKTATDGKAMKLLTSASRGTESDNGAPKLLNGQTGAASRTPNRTPVASKSNIQNPSLTRTLPDGVDELSILRQISDGLKLKSGRLQRAQIRLNPEELGTVDIKMQMKGDSVRISVSTEHQSVGELLTNSLEQLKREILAQGMHIEHIEVNSQLADGGTGQGSDTGEHDDLQEFEQAENHDDAETRTHDGFLNVKA